MAFIVLPKVIVLYLYDFFLCHASEDKESIVRPLASALSERGARVWFDEMTLRIGDSLRRKIEEGLSKSRYGVVILSPSFFKKQWPQVELDGLLSREMADAVKVILPVWHNVKAKDVREYSLPLSMRLAGNSELGIEKLAEELIEIAGIGSAVNVPEISDELSLCKRAILTEALANELEIGLAAATMATKPIIKLGKTTYSNSEKQRKLFLYAASELDQEKLIMFTGTGYELTYLGIQAAERMTRLSPIEIEKLGL
jgi:hypothetical protein